MLKKALYVYFSGYHPRNYKKLQNSFGVVWSFCYFGFVLPAMNHSETVFASAENAILYYSLIFSVILPLSGVVVVPLTLQKQMFLCPMQEKERKEYIFDLLMVKLLVPVLFAGILGGVQVLLFQRNGITLLCTLIAYLSLTVGIELYPTVIDNKTKVEKIGSQVCCIINVILAALHLFVGVFAVMKEKTLTGGLSLYLGISVVLQLILNAVILKQNLAFVIENATDYENGLRIQEVKKKGSAR